MINDKKEKIIVGLHWGGAGNDGVGHNIKAVFSQLNLDTIPMGLKNAIFKIATTTTFHARQELRLPGNIRFPNQSETEDYFISLQQDLQQKLAVEPQTPCLLNFLNAHNDWVTSTLLDRDGWRSVLFALIPLLNGKLTTIEILTYTLNLQDIKNFHRVITVTKSLHPSSARYLNKIELLIDHCEGKSLASLLTESFESNETVSEVQNIRHESDIKTSLSMSE